MSNTSEVPFPSGGKAGGGADARLTPPVEQPIGGHTSHQGRPRSWVLVAVVIAAFTAGGAAIIARLWPLFWVCVGVTLLAIPVGKLIGIMDDTVEVDGWPDEQPPAADRGSAADPGVRI
jgi:hypothetical protein